MTKIRSFFGAYGLPIIFTSILVNFLWAGGQNRNVLHTFITAAIISLSASPKTPLIDPPIIAN